MTGQGKVRRGSASRGLVRHAMAGRGRAWGWWGRRTGALTATAIACFCILGTGCSDSGNRAVDDLPQEKIATQLGATDVIVNADQFPNFAHTCWLDEGIPVGFWSTTDRVTIIVYNDWLCPGSTKEAPMTVLSGNPRDIVRAGS